LQLLGFIRSHYFFIAFYKDFQDKDITDEFLAKKWKCNQRNL